jgi:plastocyanin
MSIYILGVLVICTALVFLSSFFYKAKDSLMNNMVYVMAYTMSMGLTSGFYLGMYFKDNLLYATLFSILLSGLAGLLIGSKLHFHLMVEGLFSGIMAGMMGAMLTVMISSKQAQILIMIGILLTVGITILCILQFLSETLTSHLERYFNLIMLFGCAVLFMVFLKFPDDIIKPHGNAAKQHEQHSSSSADKKEMKQLEPEEVFNWKVEIKDYKYLSSNVSLKRDQKVLLTLLNDDSVEHDIEISPFSYERLVTSNTHSEHEHGMTKEDDSIFHLHVEPNGSNQVSFIPKEAGVYTYYCTIPGHKESGMIGKIKVS